jgi:hypothetical protein
MATFGQGINAQLGAIDYSAYQRGAAQGAQNIGQGLANLGQEVGAGLKKRGEYKAEVTAALKTADLINTTADLPEGVKKLAAEAKLQLSDPNISLREQAAIGSRMNGMFGGVLQAGLATAMKDPAQVALDKLALDTGRQALAAKENQVTAWGKSVTAATENGKLNLEKLPGIAIANGITDLDSLSRFMGAVGVQNFQSSFKTIKDADGNEMVVFMSSPGTATQVRPPTVSRPTNMAERERLTGKMKQAVLSGNWEEATSLAAALGIQGMFGAAGKNDLIRMYGSNVSSPTDGSGQSGGLDTSASREMPGIPKPEAPKKYNEQEINDAKAWLSRNPGAKAEQIAFIKKKYGLQ